MKRVFENSVIEQIPEENYQKMRVKGLVYKLTAGASKVTLKERGIFGKTMPLALNLAKKNGFKYVIAFCVAPQTKKISERAGMKVIAKGDMKTFEHKGVRPFGQVD